MNTAKHGTRSCYQNGCRRPECVQANRVYARLHMRTRYVAGTGYLRNSERKEG